jgi:hypothetical protein
MDRPANAGVLFGLLGHQDLSGGHDGNRGKDKHRHETCSDFHACSPANGRTHSNAASFDAYRRGEVPDKRALMLRLARKKPDRAANNIKGVK